MDEEAGAVAVVSESQDSMEQKGECGIWKHVMIVDDDDNDGEKQAAYNGGPCMPSGCQKRAQLKSLPLVLVVSRSIHQPAWVNSIE